MGEVKINTRPLKEHKHIYLRSCNKLVQQPKSRPECLSFNHHILVSLYLQQNQTIGLVTQTFIPVTFLLQSFLPKKKTIWNIQSSVEEGRDWFNNPAVLMEKEQGMKKRFGLLFLRMQCMDDHKAKSQIN